MYSVNMVCYYENLLDVFKKNSIVVKNELKGEDSIKLLICDDDFNEIILEVYELNNDVKINTSNSSSSLYKAIIGEMFSIKAKPIIYNSYIGTDESGKGDYLGPLVVAGFISDKIVDKELIMSGICDSKKLTDKRILELSEMIKNKYYDRVSTFTLEPQAYNSRYSVLKLNSENLTSLLSISHATVIETLLRNNSCVDALIIDKIQNIKYINEVLSSLGENVKIINIENGEENPAVAAASIMARAEYLNWLTNQSMSTGIHICKGADDRAVNTAIELIKKYGKNNLDKYVKLHFKTTQKVVKLYCNEKQPF